jgi:hypothetical protein
MGHLYQARLGKIYGLVSREVIRKLGDFPIALFSFF